MGRGSRALKGGAPEAKNYPRINSSPLHPSYGTRATHDTATIEATERSASERPQYFLNDAIP